MIKSCLWKTIQNHFASIILLSFLIRAQSFEPKFDTYPATIAHCFHQDQQGFIWIGTQEGLLRYDGYDFRKFASVPFDSASLSHNWVVDIKGDSLDNLWIATFGGGLNYYDQKKEVFTRYSGSEDQKENNYITRIIVDEDGSLWYTGLTYCLTHFKINETGDPQYDHLNFFNDSEDKTFTNSNSSQTLIKDKDRIIWIGTVEKGLVEFDKETEEIKHYRHDPDNPFSLSDNTVSSVFEDKYGNIWIGTGHPEISRGGGLCMLDKKSGKFRRFVHDPADNKSLCADGINSIYIDRTGIMWIGTWFNYLNTVPLEELLSNREPRFQHHIGLKSSCVLGLYEDRLGNIWIGERAPYFQKYDRQQNPFKNFKRDNKFPQSLTSTGTHSIYVDRSGKIWFGTDGLDLYDPEIDKYSHYYHDSKDTNSISANWIYGFAEDRSGNIYVATRNKGVNLIDRINGIFSVLGEGKPASNTSSFGITDYILASRTGGLWIASQKLGIVLYDTYKGKYSSFDLDPDTKEDLMVSNLTEDNNGVLWIGTSSCGIYSLKLNEINDPEIKHYQYDPDDIQSLSCNSVSDIIQPEVYDTSALWIATSMGLNRYDMISGEFTHYFRKDGLSTNFVLSILEDDSGNLWCSTTDGLSLYKIRSGEIMNYGSKDGLPFSSFGAFRQCAAKGPDGRLYFSGGQGVLYFLPQEIAENPNIPPIRITDFKIFEKSIQLDTSIQFKRTIQLNHDQNMFSFKFSALNYTNPEKNQYAYKMEGFYDDWIYIGNERRAAFTNLNPGEYKFTVKGSNNHGHWNEEGASINVIVFPPWWRTIWAYIGYFMVILIIVYSLRKYDLNRQRLKHELSLEHDHAEKLREIDRMKSRFFANISHEFRTPLTLILGPVEKWMRRLKNHELISDLSMMKRNANRLLRLINQLLDLSRLESGGMTLQLREENLVKVVHRYIQSFESLARLKGIKLNFESESEIIQILTDRDKIEKIMYNLLSNAFKYTPEGGEVNVSVSEEKLRDPGGKNGSELINVKGRIIIEVFNSGSYITQDEIKLIFDRFYQSNDSKTHRHEGSGIGLALTKELIELLEGNIGVKSIRDNGTTFVVTFPARPKEKEISSSDYIEYSQAKPLIIDDEIVEEFKKNTKLQNEKEGALILIVEDNADVRAYVRDNLYCEYRIIEASDGNRGFDMALENIPDLIICDVMMPEMDGFELCRKLKAHELTSHIPVILLTARATTEDKINGLQTGADDYLIKPFESRELLARVENLINQRDKLKEYYKRNLTLDSENIGIASADNKFLEKLTKIVEENLTEEDFNVNRLASDIGYSPSQLQRKVSGLTGLSPNLFIRSRKLYRAKKLLDTKYGTISEIAYEAGFNNLSYFSRCFKDQFGKLPSDYLKDIE